MQQQTKMRMTFALLKEHSLATLEIGKLYTCFVDLIKYDKDSKVESIDKLESITVDSKYNSYSLSIESPIKFLGHNKKNHKFHNEKLEEDGYQYIFFHISNSIYLKGEHDNFSCTGFFRPDLNEVLYHQNGLIDNKSMSNSPYTSIVGPPTQQYKPGKYKALHYSKLDIDLIAACEYNQQGFITIPHGSIIDYIQYTNDYNIPHKISYNNIECYLDFNVDFESKP